MAQAAEQGLLTLSEVSKRTGISMPTLQRYKKLYQDRIPSEGKGRKQRYPEHALEVFEEIKKENIGKRGRPRKTEEGTARQASRGRGRKGSVRKAASSRRGSKRKKSQAAAATSGLLTLTQISEDTGISYPTLVRYVKLHGSEIPHEGEGRLRRFYPEAVAVFRRLREESPRGRQKGSGSRKAAGSARAAVGVDRGLIRRIQALEKSQGKLEKQIKELIKQIQKPLQVTIKR